jgi:hypothetical protein
MTPKTRPKSWILAAVHATARDLRSAGFIDSAGGSEALRRRF